MSFLFGDSTPSTLLIDYIDFLRDALDFCVQILAADERIRRGSTRAAEVRRAGEAEVGRLETLGATLARAVNGAEVGTAESPTAQCAQSLMRTSADVVRTAIERVHASVAGDLASIESDARRDRERCVEALASFLLRHDLPEMTSEISLTQQGGTGYAARLHTRALDDLRATLVLEIAPAHPLAHVLRVDKLIERLEVHAPETGGWFSKEVKLRPQRLDKEYVTGLLSSATETRIELRTAADGTGVGFDLVLSDATPRVSLHRVGEGSELPPFDLDDTDTGKVHDLKSKLLAATADLPQARKTLADASLGDGPLADHRDPKVLVERLVALIAPVVQEIGKRSLTPTELTLKRQTGDGRREEIFVSRAELLSKLRPLAAASRTVFAPLGLGELPFEEPAASPASTSIFAEALAPMPMSSVPPPMPATTAAAGGDDEPSVRIDDSLERMIVTETTSKPE